MTFQNEKTPSQAMKTRISKSRKIQMAIFPTFFFWTIQSRKMSFIIFQNKKKPFQAKKTRRLKIRKIDVFQKGLTHGLAPKMAIFPTFFFSGNLNQENVFYDILERKNVFLGQKNTKFKKSKIDIFPKWLTQGFGPKMAISSTFFLMKYRPAKCFL